MASKQKNVTRNESSRTRRLGVKQKKQVAKKNTKLPGSFKIMTASVGHLWRHKKLFGGILLVYAVLYIVLVRGLAGNFQLGDARQTLEETLGSDASSATVGTALFGVLIGTAGTVSGEAAGVYQGLLFVILSLAFIWALRQTYEARQRPPLKAVFYQAMYPLIPFILVSLVIVLQLLPALIGITVYGIVTSNGIAVGALEQIVWLIVLFMSIGASIYFVSSSLFASYIVTLPNTSPMQALRAARGLVKYRRFTIIRKLIFLPIVLVVVMIGLFLPMVLVAPVAAEITFMIFMLVALPLVHAYLYTFYRELL